MAVSRVESVLRRKPEAALHDDPPGKVRWEGGLRMVATHASGRQVLTDMPAELGGSGDQVSPGWLLRTGLASCAATCIAVAAAREGIVLDTLEVEACSRSDTRGMLGIPDTDGQPVDPGPRDMQMRVRIAAQGVPADRLRALVEAAQGCAPMSAALRNAVPMDLHIEVGAG